MNFRAVVPVIAVTLLFAGVAVLVPVPGAHVLRRELGSREKDSTAGQVVSLTPSTIDQSQSGKPPGSDGTAATNDVASAGSDSKRDDVASGDLVMEPGNFAAGFSDLTMPVPRIDPTVLASRAQATVECPPPDMPLFMEDKDRALFRKTMTAAKESAQKAGRALLYAEYGSGGSTLEAAALGATVFSFESAAMFCPKVTQQAAFKCYEKANRVFYFCFDVQRKLAMWSAPRTKSKSYASFHRYVGGIDRIGVRTLDIVFVDGRFRNACALKSLLYLVQIKDENTIEPRSDGLGLLMVHDYERSQYHLIEQHFDLIARGSVLAVLRPKSGLTIDQLSDYVKYIDKYE